MSPDIQKAVEAGKLTPKQGSALAKLEPGTYVVHKSWGFGQIDAIDHLLGQITIHFKGKRSHPMQLSYAADSLTPIPADHILAKKGVTPQGCPFNCPAFPCETEYSRDMCPQTLDLLGRSVAIPIPDYLAAEGCDERVEAIRKVAGAYLGQ